MSPEFHLFLPQMRMTLPAVVERAQAAESAGFTGIALMDHLSPPGAEGHGMYDAMVTATWLAAHTEKLTVGHLVLCDAFRHPAVLAREAVSLDHASAGRFELGIGWGSVPAEFETFGVGDTAPRVRVARLRETLEVVKALWTGETVDYAGDHHRIDGGRQLPIPMEPIPIVIGGSGPRTLELVAEHADWWNCPIYAIDRLAELRPRCGAARVSLQQMVAMVTADERREDVVEITQRRFGDQGGGLLLGDGDELRNAYEQRIDQGVERFYVWFSDFAVPEKVAAFGDQVIAPLT